MLWPIQRCKGCTRQGTTEQLSRVRILDSHPKVSIVRRWLQPCKTAQPGNAGWKWGLFLSGEQAEQPVGPTPQATAQQSGGKLCSLVHELCVPQGGVPVAAAEDQRPTLCGASLPGEYGVGEASNPGGQVVGQIIFQPTAVSGTPTSCGARAS